MQKLTSSQRDDNLRREWYGELTRDEVAAKYKLASGAAVAHFWTREKKAKRLPDLATRPAFAPAGDRVVDQAALIGTPADDDALPMLACDDLPIDAPIYLCRVPEIDGLLANLHREHGNDPRRLCDVRPPAEPNDPPEPASHPLLIQAARLARNSRSLSRGQ